MAEQQTTVRAEVQNSQSGWLVENLARPLPEKISPTDHVVGIMAKQKIGAICQRPEGDTSPPPSRLDQYVATLGLVSRLQSGDVFEPPWTLETSVNGQKNTLAIKAMEADPANPDTVYLVAVDGKRIKQSDLIAETKTDILSELTSNPAASPNKAAEFLSKYAKGEQVDEDLLMEAGRGCGVTAKNIRALYLQDPGEEPKVDPTLPSTQEAHDEWKKKRDVWRAQEPARNQLDALLKDNPILDAEQAKQALNILGINFSSSETIRLEARKIDDEIATLRKKLPSLPPEQQQQATKAIIQMEVQKDILKDIDKRFTEITGSADWNIVDAYYDNIEQGQIETGKAAQAVSFLIKGDMRSVIDAILPESSVIPEERERFHAKRMSLQKKLETVRGIMLKGGGLSGLLMFFMLLKGIKTNER